MIVNDNIEDRKQDDALNYSSLEFQGEEEEVQEHSQSLSITEHDNSFNNWIEVPEGNIEICVDSDIHKDIKLDISNHTVY